MAMSFTWNSAYESYPSNKLNRNSIDNEIRKWSRGIREFMEIEHNFGPYTDKDDGSHIPGKTTVLLEGDETTRDALTDVQEGGLYLLDDGSSLQLQVYLSGAWVDVGSLSHGDMEGLDLANDHPQYAYNAEGEQLDLTGSDLDMNENSLIAPVVAETYSGVVLYKHRSLAHSTLGSKAAVSGNFVNAKFKGGAYSISNHFSEDETYDIGLPSDAFVFCPNLYAPDPNNLALVPHRYSGWGISVIAANGSDFTGYARGRYWSQQ